MARRRSGGIPFLALAAQPGFERNAVMERDRLRRIDPTSPLLAELERYLANALRAGAQDMQQLLDQRAQFRQGRPESATTAHIRKLATDNPTLRPAALYELRDTSIIPSMSKSAFRNKVAAARRS